MKQIVKTIIITFLVAGSALPALAQGKGKLIQRVTSDVFLTSKSAPVLSADISAAVQRTVAQAQSSAAMQTPGIAPTFNPDFGAWEHPAWRVYIPEPKTTQTRSWLEQQRRNIKAWQLKRQHAKQVALWAQLAALPQLQTERTFRATDLNDFLITDLPDNAVPTVPLIEHPDYVYRGLGLNNKQDIPNILTNGLRVQDVGSYSNGLLLTLAASLHDAATVSSSKYTNLTREPKIALHYALRNSRGISDRIAVIVGVRGEDRRGPIIQVQHDIPASRVPLLLALLNVDGVPTWCRIQLQEGEFVVTPYENK